MFPKEIGSSGVIAWPSEASITTKVPCIICGNNISLEAATTGACYADGQQAFACREHTWNKATWLRAWARFAYTQTSGEHNETEVLSRKVA